MWLEYIREKPQTSDVESIEGSPGFIKRILVRADMMTQETFESIIDEIARDGSVSREELPHDADESVLDELCEMGWLTEEEPGVWTQGWKADLFSGPTENADTEDTE